MEILKIRSARHSHPWLSPWLIIGSVALLALILLVLGAKNIHREKTFMERTLLSQARILTEALEASTRTGMMGRSGWGLRQVQLLMEQTVKEPQVLYLRLVDASGRVVAASDPGEIGSQVHLPKGPRSEDQGAFVTFQTKKAFEVIRSYTPWSRHRRSAGIPCPVNGCLPAGRHGASSTLASKAPRFPGSQPLFLIVGLDATPFEEALRQDMRQNAFLLALLFTCGAAGFVSLFWAHGYRLAKRSLRTMEAMTDTIFAQMPAALIATDQDGTIQRVNSAARRIYGTGAQPGRPLSDIPPLSPVLEKLRKHPEPLEEEVTLVSETGETFHILLTGTAIRDMHDRVSGYAILGSDVTTIKTLQERLRRSERLAALGRLAAGVAHEIRNPLSSIKGFAAILANKVSDDPTAREAAKVMQLEVERLNRVITELLEFARPTDLNRRSVDIGNVIDHTLRLVENDAAASEVSVHVDVDPPDLKAEVDADRLSQALLNLYLNAIQAMPRGGQLHIRARRHDGRLVLTIADTGPGIPDQVLPHIFDPYFTTKAQGVGLGLAIVHKVVEAHGGEISVESRNGKGTVFSLVFPDLSPRAGSGSRETVRIHDLEQADERSAQPMAGEES